MQSHETRWESVQLGQSDSAEAGQLLGELARNEIAAIKIGQFLCKEELQIIKSNLQEKNFQWYHNKFNEQGRIGISATGYCHLSDGKQQYFNSVSAAEETRDEIFDGIQNPIHKIINFFGARFNTRIASESELENANYFTGLIRAMGAKSTLHYDYAPKQLQGWSVADAEEQFGLVIYLQMPTVGGSLNIYNRSWSPKDEQYNNDQIEKGTYGFIEEFLVGTPYASVLPSEGDLVVFKSRNFHQVDEIVSAKPRLGITTFMSQKGNSLSLWS